MVNHLSTTPEPVYTPPPRARPTTLSADFVGKDSAVVARAVIEALNLVCSQLDSVDDPTTATAMDLESRQAALDQVDLDSPLGEFPAALEEIAALWLNHAVWYHHPRYIAHLNCPISSTAVAGDLLSTITNTAVESWDQAGSAALIEQKILRWIAQHLGWAKENQPNGCFTSGGTQSNLHALLIARDKTLQNSNASIEELRVFCTSGTHHSIARAAHILGLPKQAVRLTPSDRLGRMNPSALLEELQECEETGFTPMVVVATAGTTDLGAVDPIAEISSICHTRGVHLHVDAAYGGVLAFSPLHRTLLKGIDTADSVSIDFHKSFFQPVACSALLFRQGKDLAIGTWHANYLNPSDSPELNLANYSLQTTRRFDAAKLWLTLRTYGAEAIGNAFDACCALAQEAAAYILASESLELHSTPQLSTVIFRPARCDRSPRDIRNQLLHDAYAVIAFTVIDGEQWLKLTILDPTLTTENITDVLSAVIFIATTTEFADTERIENA